jgi:hypothetical protein
MVLRLHEVKELQNNYIVVQTLNGGNFMKKFYKICYHYFGEEKIRTEYIPKKIKRHAWWLTADTTIIIDQVSVVKM